MAFEYKILLVDDEVEAREALAMGLEARGFAVHQLGRGNEVVASARSLWPSLIILDVVLPDLPGTEVLKRLREDPVTRGIPALLLTAKPDIVAQQIPGFRESSDRFVEKPGQTEDILRTVREMLTGKKR
ncbi:MAG: hypothetical protein COV76_03560 [Candidatus Omnitrophica bacterium CG11_big_fil_rev_8_21_14_0_20_64_10]|nr:MAG: hypothetical protein COV76_03560 [Candidatus Omnitrophica bacterium CG11_big_fil_rev_8_21_14_0_20_64_10]